MQSPTECWQTAVSNSINLEDAYSPFVLDAEPIKSLKFNTFWRVMKRTKIEMTSGSVHVHRGVSILNSVINYYDYSEVGGAKRYMCLMIMLVVNGFTGNGKAAQPFAVSVSTENRLFTRSYVNSNLQAYNYSENLS